jgi:hypothetical protein
VFAARRAYARCSLGLALPDQRVGEAQIPPTANQPGGEFDRRAAWLLIQQRICHRFPTGVREHERLAVVANVTMQQGRIVTQPPPRKV